MSDRRTHSRPDSPNRRTSPRPPLWLNLTLLVLALGTFAWARYHRNQVQEKATRLFKPTPASPQEMNRIRDELASLDLSREQLEKELENRLAFVRSLEGEEFYISIDSERRKFQLRLGKNVAREADVQIGAPRTVEAEGKTWTFVPVKGAFNIESKESGHTWTPPPWAYALSNQPPPENPQPIANGLGRYVIFLPNGYIIHSPPAEESPLDGPKPGSFMVPEADLAAIWARITDKTRVYIF
ncbi:MAG TPA: L,D-transpeptidase [Thermoanaerobaculia bacterium]